MRTIRVIAVLVSLVASSRLELTAQDLPPDYTAGAAHGLKMGKHYGYGFDNWRDPVGSITFKHYAKAFYNVPEDSTLPGAWIDYGVYQGVAKNLSGGHCFAMSSMSIAMNTIGGFHGFCCPTAQYRASNDVDTLYSTDSTFGTFEGGPADPALLEAMRIMQNHQLSLSTILTYVDQINSKIARHGFRMLGFFEAALASEDAVLLNLTMSIRPVEGQGTMVAHSVIAYKVERTGPQQGKIWIVDPNRCAQYNTGADSVTNHGWYHRGVNYVSIDNGKWLYYGAADPTEPPVPWPMEAAERNDVSNGFLLCVPMSRVGTAGVSLGSLGASVGNISSGLRETVGMIFISGSAPHIKQVSTPDNRRLYDPTTNSLEEDDDKRVDRLVPIPLSMAPRTTSYQPNTVELFAADRSYDTITVQATTGADGATLTYMGRGAYASIQTSTPNSEITVGFYDLASPNPSLIVDAKDSHTMKITVIQRYPNDRVERKILESVAVAPGTTRLTIPMQSTPEVSLQHE
ncbi:MAG: hypothetical protein RLZZ273_1325 [Bacteroidota bacterium]|jgi:hypothetical protein